MIDKNRFKSWGMIVPGSGTFIRLPSRLVTMATPMYGKIGCFLCKVTIDVRNIYVSLLFKGL